MKICILVDFKEDNGLRSMSYKTFVIICSLKIFDGAKLEQN